MNGTECDKKKDYLEIFSILPDTNSTDGEIFVSEGVFCGENMTYQPLITVSNKAMFRFQTFERTTKLYRGFKVSFASASTSCGGNIDADSGVLTSPGWYNYKLSVVHSNIFSPFQDILQNL